MWSYPPCCLAVFLTSSKDLPATDEELSLHMQLSYKQAIELAEEQAINMLMRGNNYNLTKRRFYQDLVVLGIGAVKTSFNTSEGVTVDYVDPANLVILTLSFLMMFIMWVKLSLYQLMNLRNSFLI